MTVIAICGWAVAMLTPESIFQKIGNHSILGPMIHVLNKIFWVLNCAIGLQIALTSRSLFALLAFCTQRAIAFSSLHLDSPILHLFAFYVAIFLGNPLRPLAVSSLVMDINNFLGKTH
ncbi:uncharacterized protein LOC132202600 [Neocloeon triangulifer]|uniref:uncharacterized protein LOC132202600 n=1 Tax=Neocloeon triangulifer TaxID=2078957 RepID=UPI00286F2269|nr:uncharacterized protein LOC132202600 [Neocloeon triangulifer]